MKMEQQNSDIVNELLPRYCEGDVSEEERRIVEDWIGQSDENYKVAKQIHTIYLATDTMTVLDQVDTEGALKKVFVGISKERKRVWLNWMQRAAAVLFIPALITILVQNGIQEPADVRMVAVKTNPGMTTMLELPDGTTVHLNSESSLQYPSHFDGDHREVKLSGEACFSVTKNAKQRFVVSTPHQARIEVLGTVFNVEAFEKDTIITTTLLEGQVCFAYSTVDASKSIVMKPGQKLIYNANRIQTQLFTTTGESETAWKDGRIVFQDTPFQQALRMVEKRYNVEFVVLTSKYEKDSFTGAFSSQRLDRVLEVFEKSSHIRWRYIDTDNASNEKSRIEIY